MLPMLSRHSGFNGNTPMGLIWPSSCSLIHSGPAGGGAAVKPTGKDRGALGEAPAYLDSLPGGPVGASS